MNQPEVDLKCAWLSDQTEGETIVQFVPDPDKKSAFWLSKPDKDSYTVASPAVCQISRQSHGVFVLGGFQLFSNSRSVEVYIQEPEDHCESYLTTNRGIPAKEEGSDIFKTICVIPGGPRPVIRFKLKMLGLQPVGASHLELKSLKVTARIPDDTHQNQGNLPPLQAQGLPSAMGLFGAVGETGSLPPNLQSFSLTTDPSQSKQDDIGAAMAGVSFMIRSAEERITKIIQQGMMRSEQITSSQSRQLASMMQAQTQLLQHQHHLLQLQETQLSKQSSDIQALKEQVRMLLNKAENEKRTNSDPPSVEQSEQERMKMIQEETGADIDSSVIQSNAGAPETSLSDEDKSLSYEMSASPSDIVSSHIDKESTTDQDIQSQVQ